MRTANLKKRAKNPNDNFFPSLTRSAPLVTAASRSSCAMRALSEDAVRTARVTSAVGSEEEEAGVWESALRALDDDDDESGDAGDDKEKRFLLLLLMP